MSVCTRVLHQLLPYYIGVVGRMARPLVMPEIFNGDSSWDYHFENVAVVNDWASCGGSKFA